MSEIAQDFWDRLVGRSQAASGQLRVKSALNPMLWLCGIISLPCLLLSWAAHDVNPISTIFAFVGVAPVAVTCLLALYFALFKPDKLQSEEYQIRHETLELIKQKGSTVELSPSSIVAIPNPLHNAIDSDVKP